jgi:exosortase
MDHREEGSEGRWFGLDRSNRVWIAAIAVLFLVLFRHEVGRLVTRWLNDANWSHGFLIPALSLYFVHRRRDRILQVQASPSLVGCALLLLWIGVYLFNSVSPSGYAYLRSFSMVMALASVILFLGGWAMLRQTWLPVLYLLFAVPLPDRSYAAMTLPLRMAAAKVAASVLDLLPQVEATSRGAVIDVVCKGRVMEPALDVAEACSGMRLLMAMAALGVALAYIQDRPRWHRAILLVCTIPIAVLCNLARVTATGFIYVLIDPRYAQGVAHDLLGLAMLPLALGAYSLLGWFLSSLFVSDTVRDVIVRRRSDALERPQGPSPEDLPVSAEIAAPSPVPSAPVVRTCCPVHNAILLCAALLALCTAAVSALTDDRGISRGKGALGLRRPLDRIDESSLAPFRIVSRLRIQDTAVLRSLGTTDYVQWAVQESTSDGIAAGQSVLVFITYYGRPDRVPHVPEECYGGAGFQCLGVESVSLELGGPGEPRSVAARVLNFGPGRQDAAAGAASIPVVYLFRVNGRYAADRDAVRRVLNRDFLSGQSYFSKVELVFGNGGDLPPDKARVLETSRRLLSLLLPVLERDHWPEWPPH